MFAKLDTPDYFWEKDFFAPNRDYKTADEVRRIVDEATKEMTDLTSQFEGNGLLGEHTLVFNPLITKGQRGDLSGNFSGSSGGLLGGYMSGNIEGESRPTISCVFCWSFAQQGEKKSSTFISALPCERVVIQLQEQGVPTIRFKYNLDKLVELHDWVYENPGILINEDQVVYAKVLISREQLKQGYLGLR